MILLGHSSRYGSSYSHQPRCAASGCNNTVYVNPLLGPFDYCCPKCRDEHLLPVYNKKLKEDIEQFERDCKTKSYSLPPTCSKSSSTVNMKIYTKPKDSLGFEYCKSCRDKVCIIYVPCIIIHVYPGCHSWS